MRLVVSLLAVASGRIRMLRRIGCKSSDCAQVQCRLRRSRYRRSPQVHGPVHQFEKPQLNTNMSIKGLGKGVNPTTTQEMGTSSVKKRKTRPVPTVKLAQSMSLVLPESRAQPGNILSPGPNVVMMVPPPPPPFRPPVPPQLDPSSRLRRGPSRLGRGAESYRTVGLCA